MEVYFVLVEPAVPENVGASARALKTMGFNRLRLINPCSYLSDNAKWIAHGSLDVLHNSEIYNSFEEATGDLDFIIGTSAKKRRIQYDIYPIDQIPEIIIKKTKTVSKIGIIFGKEESGLDNKYIKQCDILSYIPMKLNYPSLNLSQAVMLYSYFISKIIIINKEYPITIQNESSYKILKNKISTILEKLGFEKNSNIYNRIFERLSVAGNEDINLLNSIANKFLKKN